MCVYAYIFMNMYVCVYVCIVYISFSGPVSFSRLYRLFSFAQTIMIHSPRISDDHQLYVCMYVCVCVSVLCDCLRILVLRVRLGAQPRHVVYISPLLLSLFPLCDTLVSTLHRSHPTLLERLQFISDREAKAK